MSNFVTGHPGRPCAISASSRPLNPVVISSNTTATFVLCTVPKAGCTNVRKLMHAIISDPVHEATDAFGQFFGTHVATYPTIWHYGIPPTTQTSPPVATPPPPPTSHRKLLWPWSSSGLHKLWQPEAPESSQTPETTTHAATFRRSANSVHSMTARHAPEHTPPTSQSAPETATLPPQIPSAVPTFTIGRNPYIRVLSGFLDKMITNPGRHDAWTRMNVNKHLQFEPQARWQPSVRDFHSFVRALALRGVDGVDNHFRSAVAVCTETFKFDYYLRLEEMEEWFPCWMDALGLRGWTERGWADTPHGRMYVGEGRHFVTLNSYKTKRPLRPQWDESAGRATKGVEGVDWAWVEGSQCWWNPPSMQCAEYYDSFTRSDGVVEPGGSPAGSGGGRRRMHAKDAVARGVDEDLGPAEVVDIGGAAEVAARATGPNDAAHDQHDTQAQLRWQEYYTQEIADLVYYLYNRDFTAFGYERYIVDDADA